MRARVLALALLAAGFPSLRADEPSDPPVLAGNPQVTLPLAEYERIRRLEERASVTVVDTLSLGGSFQSRNLTISFSGRSSGKRPPEEVLATGEGVFVYGCAGSAIVSKSETGFTLTPLAASFDVKCRLSVRGADRVEFRLPRAVLWIEAQVPDGELVAGGSDEGGRAVSVVRRTSGGRENLPAGATGRYRITLRPDETRFRYEIDARNPNRRRQSLELAFVSGEHVLQVDAAVPYETEGERYRFELPPGDVRIILTGTLAGKSFTPPVEGVVQYVLLDAHPLLLASPSGSPRRVSPQEVGIAAEFRGAQAFLLGPAETLAWDATRLEALRTTSFAVRRESHVLFVGAEGRVSGESGFSVENQGASEVRVGVKPEPTFASVGGEPLLVTRRPDGELRLPLGPGAQQLAVQHRQSLSRSFGIASGTAILPRLSASSTYASVELRYPAEWLPLLEGFASERRVHLPGRGVLLLAVLVFLLTDQALRLLGLASRRRLSAAVLLALASAVSWEAAWASLAADGAVLVLAAAAPLRRVAWTASRIALLVVLVAVSAIAVLVYSPSAMVPSRGGLGAMGSAMPSALEEASLKTRQSLAAPQMPPPPRAADEAASYQGLPARFELPSGARRTFFSREMLAADGPREVRVLAISATLAFWLGAGLVAAAAAAALRLRREIAAGWTRLLADAIRPQSAAPAPEPLVAPA